MKADPPIRPNVSASALVGDEVSLYATIEKVGRTSMTVHVEAWRRSRAEELARELAETDPLTGCLNRRSIAPATAPAPNAPEPPPRVIRTDANRSGASADSGT